MFIAFPKWCWPRIFVAVGDGTAGSKMHTFFFLMEFTFYKEKWDTKKQVSGRDDFRKW